MTTTPRRPLLASLLTAVLVAGMSAPGPLPARAAEPVTFHSDGNPILADGSYYSADAAPLVADGKLYLYTGHDEAAQQQGGFEMHDYGIFETSDVESGDWTHHPENMVPGDVFGWATGNGAYAGQAVRGDDGAYYWYVPVETTSTAFANRMAIGVARSDSPTGPWVDALGEPLLDWGDVFGTSTDGQEVIDPAIFKDTDGRWYLYWGSWSVARVVELNPTMTATLGAISTMSGLTGFFEAPWVVKRNGLYHMVYDWKQGGSACTPSNYQACVGWATATSPKGPWTYRGIILGGTSATTVHPSLIEFNEQWYLTYHTKDAELGGHFRRSVAIDAVSWDGDTILPVTQTWADDPAFRLTDNVALDATPTASFTETPPMRIGAVNDGRALTALLPPDQWGNYRGTTSSHESDHVTYTWEAPVRIDGVGIEFERDGNWIRPPASWELDYLDAAGTWQPVPGVTYPTPGTSFTDVTFDPITTSALRATFHGLPEGAAYHSVAVSEWEVYAVDAAGYLPVAVSTRPGTAPALPEAVRLTYPGGDQGWAPVTWRPIEPALYATAGTFTVEGRALGYDAGYVTATVTVDPNAVPPVVTDTTAPSVSLAVFGTQGADGWYSSPVTATVMAEDSLWYRTDVSVKAGTGEWITATDARSASATISTEGTTQVQGRAVDGSGNASTVVTREVKLDLTRPTLSVAVDPQQRSSTITAADTLSGLAGVQYRFDAGQWTNHVAGAVLPAPDDLPHTLTVRATDVAGNVSTATASIPLGDPSQLSGNIAPYATGTASYTAPWNSAKGLNDGAAAVFEAAPGKLGVDWGTWPKGGEITATLTWPFDVTTDSSGVWWFSDAADAANAGMIPPRSWTLQYLAADGTTWTDVVLTDGSTYQRARDAWNTLTFEPVTTRAMRVVLQSWGAADGQGSPGIREWQVVAVNSDIPDTTAPALTVALDPAAPDGKDGWYVTAPLVTATATDEEDADPLLEVSLNGADWEELDAGARLDRAGDNTAAVRATDAAGNVSAPREVSAKVDTDEPVSSARFDAATRLLTLRGADATSGLAALEYRLPGGAWTTYTTAVAVPATAGSVEFRGLDVAGNLERAKTVRTETAASPSPTVTVTLPPDQYSTPGFHSIGGRWWYTACEPYSQTVRCRTEIWATTVTQVDGRFVVRTGWVFNTLTYLPRMTKAQWGDSHLANAGEYLISGRRWRTECNTPATGANNCRSYLWTSYIASEKLPAGGYRYFWTSGWLLNNIVRFKA